MFSDAISVSWGQNQPLSLRTTDQKGSAKEESFMKDKVIEGQHGRKIKEYPGKKLSREKGDEHHPLGSVTVWNSETLIDSLRGMISTADHEC